MSQDFTITMLNVHFFKVFNIWALLYLWAGPYAYFFLWQLIFLDIKTSKPVKEPHQLPWSSLWTPILFLRWEHLDVWLLQGPWADFAPLVRKGLLSPSSSDSAGWAGFSKCKNVLFCFLRLSLKQRLWVHSEIQLSFHFVLFGVQKWKFPICFFLEQACGFPKQEGHQPRN